MVLPLARRWLAAVLLTAVLAPDAFPVAMARHRCACGMVVGCCCLRKAAMKAMKAMKAGDHCSLRSPAQSCGVRPGREQAVEIRPQRNLAAWVGMALRDGLRIPRSASGTLADLDDSPPHHLLPDPPVPPPRLVPAV